MRVHAPVADPPDALRAAVQLLSSASGWATMTDYWGLDSIEAGRAASEAIAALLKPGRA